MTEGVAGLLRDKSRKPGKAPLPPSAVKQVVDLALALKRGVFRSIVDLQEAINRFIAETNSNPKPFVWIAEPARVLATIARGKQALESIH
jgi:hypothetical protein